MRKPDRGPSFAGRDYIGKRKSIVITLSEIIAQYSAIRRPRGPYRTPMPDELIR